MGKKQGKGTAVTFVSASGDIAGVCITDVQDGGVSVGALDGVCMTSVAQEKVANELPDLGTVTVSLLHDPTIDVYKLIKEKGVLTITSPISVTGNLTAESETGNAFISNYSKGRPVNELMSSSIEFTWSGDGSYVYTPESA